MPNNPPRLAVTWLDLLLAVLLLASILSIQEAAAKLVSWQYSETRPVEGEFDQEAGLVGALELLAQIQSEREALRRKWASQRIELFENKTRLDQLEQLLQGLQDDRGSRRQEALLAYGQATAQQEQLKNGLDRLEAELAVLAAREHERSKIVRLAERKAERRVRKAIVQADLARHFKQHAVAAPGLVIFVLLAFSFRRIATPASPKVGGRWIAVACVIAIAIAAVVDVIGLSAATLLLILLALALSFRTAGDRT